MNPRSSSRTTIRRLNVLGLFVVCILLFAAGGWAATMQISGAVIAPGTVVVESNLKKVQHPTGGVVQSIRVKEGDFVKEGELVLRLDDTMTRATLGIVRSQLDELQIREARLVAERSGAELMSLPPSFEGRNSEPVLMTAFAAEQSLFESRRRARAGQHAQLRERIAQIRNEIGGLTAQQEAKEREIKFIAEELEGVSLLYSKNLVSITRFTQLQRDQAKLEGERGFFGAEIARAHGKIAELELQIIQLDQDFRTEILRDLRDAQAKLVEVKERVIAAEDQLKRIEMRSPYSGFVHQLAVHTIGGVITAGETIMQIVSREDSLVVEAKISPQDIDQVTMGSKVIARIMAGNQRTTPDLSGEIARVSADLTREQQTGMTYYLVRATLDPEDLVKLKGFTLVPGMPVEVFVQTQDRTPLGYLLKPLYEQIARALRER
jgi:HlyD family secretion protein